MLNLYKVETQTEGNADLLTTEEKISIYYHNLFDFPLNFSELVKWKAGLGLSFKNVGPEISNKNGYYFVNGKSGVVYKRLLHKRFSSKKMSIAKKAARIISYIPFVKMVGLTGSLAMYNSAENSDVDLLVVTQEGRLWTTRFLVYSLFKLLNVSIRKPGDTNEKDKLCLNMWMDESVLTWSKKDRNIYTAHEIAQIVPLFSKDKTYSKFIYKNKWVLKFWPNAVDKKYLTKKEYVLASKAQKTVVKNSFIENICFSIQKKYMQNKISREVVTKNKAFFHPQDWGSFVLKRISLLDIA